MPQVANVAANVRVSRERKICVKFENNVCNLYVALTNSKCRRLEGKGRILVGNFSVAYKKSWWRQRFRQKLLRRLSRNFPPGVTGAPLEVRVIYSIYC